MMHSRFLGFFSLAVVFVAHANGDSSWEVLFKAALKPQRARETLRHLTRRPHMAGTPEDHANALWMEAQFLEFGIPSVEIEESWPLLNKPLSRSLTLLSPFLYAAPLVEDIIPEDPDSRRQNAVPSFFGYGSSGNVSAALVYANFGTVQDFDALKERGIDVRGKIVLVRYGSVFRGLKVRAAELAGAAGVLVYSDPKEDGINRGPVYPDGPYRPPSSLQRGSVHYPTFYPGDPLTPGRPANKNATRIPQDESPTLPKIPALPISYQDAEPLLKALTGHGLSAIDMGKDWQGSLNLTYFTGPYGLANLYVNNSFAIAPIWNVIARIPGYSEPERQIILGNHRDAWVYGAADPHAGTSVMMEVAFGLGRLYRLGWRPKRTIVIASWDAEEYGLVGSTEWVEEHAEDLKKHGAVYINTDVAVTGKSFKVSASPSLSYLIREVTKAVEDPDTHKSVYEQWRTNANNPWKTPHGLKMDNSSKEAFVGALGFGSDFVGFLQHIGIASMDIRFQGPYGVYHSNYDSFNWMDKFGDPTYEYHVALASVMGLLTLRLSDAPVMSFRFEEYAENLYTYAQDLKGFIPEVLKSDRADSFAPLFSAIQAYMSSASEIDAEIRDAEATVRGQTRTCRQWHRQLFLQSDALYSTSHGNMFMDCPQLKTLNLSSLNDRIMFAERHFLDPDGIPGREWYKHVVYAPDEWAGYSAAMFPSLKDVLKSGNMSAIVERVERVSKVLRAAAGQLLAP